MIMDNSNNNACEVKIDNTSYYLPCDRVGDLVFVDGYLINFGSSSLRLRSGFSYTETVYPYVNCSSMSICDFRASRDAEAVPVRSNYELVSNGYKTLNFESMIFFTLLIILGVKLLWKN